MYSIVFKYLSESLEHTGIISSPRFDGLPLYF